MATVSKQIQSADEAICKNIESLGDQRGLLSQNILSHLRNLVEGVAVLLQSGSPQSEFRYDAIESALSFVKSRAKINFLGKFHNLIQKSASHYTLDEDASERLMLKYYEYLHRIRGLLLESFGIATLANLEKFPVDLDPSLREYHEKISERIKTIQASRLDNSICTRDRYYIHKTRPFFVGNGIYYEVTFYRAVNKVSKFDRIIAFTHIDMTDKYSAMLTLQRDSIDVLDQTMPITIIRDWEVSIRPCEFNNFARLLGININANIASLEYRYLMKRLTQFSGNLLDIIDMPNSQYEVTKDAGTSGVIKPVIFPVLDEVRRIVGLALRGHNLIRYLLLRMHNQVLKPQYNWEKCRYLSELNLKFGCIPFDTMPFCSSPIEHNPRYWDLVESLDSTHRNHELLARRVRNNVERYGILYTPVRDHEGLGDVVKLISIYNNKIYSKHFERRLMLDKDHVFIQGYENNTVAILEKIQEYANSGIDGYTSAVERWLKETYRGVDDEIKLDALKRLFSQSKVALVYGAAGTGKSTMVDHIAKYFNDKEKLFLAHTNPAKDNLQRKVTAQNSTFRTISSQIYQSNNPEYDLLVIDECSTVSNTDLLKVLERTNFKLLVLVGDVYQIESIQFGNWFSIIKSFIPRASIFELTTPYRTKDPSLLNFWDKVRNIDDDIAEIMARNDYSTVLDKSLFETQGKDEIILCLNYDGLYGINNINRFLQSSNPRTATIWRDSTFKIGDPILFNETERFRPLIYNNLKGWIVGIDHAPDKIQFDIQLDRPVSELDVDNEELEWMGESTVRFSVKMHDVSDDDDDSLDTSVPFQVAYAVSIHKAQGLEYESVKIVITDANEDDITHSIFYTAVTRARKLLKIFWTPETQQRVLQGLRRDTNVKDVHLLACRRGLHPLDR
jgi:hypothetical protein